MDNEHTQTGWNWAHLTLLASTLAGLTAAHALGWPPAHTALVASVLIIGWLSLAEWRWPHRRDWMPTRTDLRRDGIYFVLAAVAQSATRWLVLIASLAIGAFWSASTVLSEMPLWIAVPLAVWLGELVPYALHRAEHAGGWLWQVHALHHAPSSVNTTNNVTAHPINVALVEAARLLPLQLLGFSAEAIVYAGILAQAQSFATHANTPGTMGWLNRVIGTAELHRRHHSAIPEEAQNFGTSIPLWDQLFGTYRGLSTPQPQRIGLFTPNDYPALTDTLRWLVYPLRRVGHTGQPLQRYEHHKN
ncbi:MAG: sterol desaturase family protein [Hydrogenophaga sp.]|nr:sterol desaturase family protein [Hydrogenophaga sp.]